MTRPGMTLSEIARIAGVSKMTVSNVINGKKGVAEETRQRIMEVIQETGYIANRSARNLASGRTRTIGLVVPKLNSNYTLYIGEILRGAGDAADQSHWDLLVCTTSDDEEREFRRIQSLASGLADGILVLLPRAEQSYLALLQETHIPVITLDHGLIETPLPSIDVDNHTGGRLATQHLLDLGHRRIGFVGGTYSRAHLERLAGYREVLEENGIPVDETLIAQGDYSQPSGFQAAEQLLDLTAPPTAIFALSDAMAFGIMESAGRRGLRIPDDLSVVGFDDIPMAGWVHPQLTTIRQPLYKLGETAINLIIAMTDGETLPGQRMLLPVELMVRASTAKPSR